MLKQALKEWAAICRALELGQQAILLRKGGIAEARGAFEVEHRRFWLFPTFLHQQQQDGLKPEAQPLLQQALAERPTEGRAYLALFADVAEVYHVAELAPLLQLAPLHQWSEATVRARFAYRRPGLHVLAVRVHRVSRPLEIEDTPHYAGCKSWVELEQPLPTEGAVPVMDETPFAALLRTLDQVLLPPALA